MKLSLLSIATLVVSGALVTLDTASAAKCISVALRMHYALDPTTFLKPCPTILVNGTMANEKYVNTLTTTALKALSPCQSSECLSALPYMVSNAVDCEVDGTNPRKLYSAYQELCEEFRDGNVTVSEAKKIFKDVFSSVAATTKPPATTTTPWTLPPWPVSSGTRATTIAGVTVATTTTLVASLLL